jgi:hypothetical protein
MESSFLQHDELERGEAPDEQDPSAAGGFRVIIAREVGPRHL